MTEHFLVERDGPAALLTFNRPEARNSMTFEMYDALHDACTELDADPTVRVLVLRGAGDRAFASGTDIRQFLDFKTREAARGYEARLTRVLSRLAGMSKPTIAMLQGDAIGGGLFIALACDLRLAAPHARFGVPVARTLGNFLAPVSLSLLVAALGPGRARELVLTARLLDAEEAKASGLIDRIHPAPELESRARARREPRRDGSADDRGDEGSHATDAGGADAARPRRPHRVLLSEPRLPRGGSRVSRKAEARLAGTLTRGGRGHELRSDDSAYRSGRDRDETQTAERAAGLLTVTPGRRVVQADEASARPSSGLDPARRTSI